MGVRNFLIEGVSCTGKTTVCDELARRGYHAVHGDRELAYWGDPVTGAPTDSRSFENWIWDLRKVRDLVADRRHLVSFLCGGSRNHQQFLSLLDGAFVMQIDRETLESRLALRGDDEWSGSPSVGEAGARRQLESGEGIPAPAFTIDATAPIACVVDSILEHVTLSGKSSP